MIIGFRSIEIFIPEARSLKDKRQVLRRVKDRIKSGYNVSYAEIDYHDKWQRCVLGLVSVGVKRADVDNRLDSILRMIEQDHRVTVLNVEREYL